MNIQWYPGHMHKAGKEIRFVLPNMDLIIEILDARIPFSSQNPFLAKLRGDKSTLKVLNKSDLADPVVTQQWQNYLEQEQGVKTFAMSSQQPDRVRDLIDLAQQMLPANSNSTDDLQTLIMGIPNVGKSTLINILAGRKIAKTGNEPAITKGQQRIDTGKGLVLFDTPGMLWPNLENQNSGLRLAATGAIKDTAIAHDSIAYFLAEYLLAHYPAALRTRYQLDNLPTQEHAFLELLGKNRGCLGAGGKVNMDKVAKIIIGEFRDGSLGRITLETPEMMLQELVALDAIRKEKAEKKLARKQKWRNTAGNE